MGCVKHRSDFSVKVDGRSVFDYRFSNASGSKVATSLLFEEMNARVAAGIPQEDYDKLAGSPKWGRGGLSKCDVLVWYRANQLMEAIANDKAYRKAKAR